MRGRIIYVSILRCGVGAGCVGTETSVSGREFAWLFVQANSTSRRQTMVNAAQLRSASEDSSALARHLTPLALIVIALCPKSESLLLQRIRFIPCVLVIAKCGAAGELAA
ncbi:hypothetical protein C8R45DRAFT_971515 [Mycena sanguinolenta]|nr:hypothetical protein C8R45DRAFT_971515 [Mycena sanguinolenta]